MADTVFATSIDHQSTRIIYIFPEDFKGNITTLNADETKLAGSWAHPRKREIHRKHPNKGEYFDRIFDAKIPHTLFTIDIESRQLGSNFIRRIPGWDISNFLLPIRIY